MGYIKTVEFWRANFVISRLEEIAHVTQAVTKRSLSKYNDKVLKKQKQKQNKTKT